MDSATGITLLVLFLFFFEVIITSFWLSSATSIPSGDVGALSSFRGSGVLEAEHCACGCWCGSLGLLGPPTLVVYRTLSSDCVMG